MSETLETITGKVAQVSDTYARKCNVNRDDDWYLLKLQEELGELSAEYLRLSGRGRTNDLSETEIRARMEREASDLLAHLLLFARHNQIDLEAALAGKWYKYLDGIT